MEGKRVMVVRRSMLALAAPLLAAAGGTPKEAARASLSPAQILLFETPHLALLRPPVRLAYAFRRDEGAKAPVADAIRLEVRASAERKGRRDVRPEFLTGPRAMNYPPALGFAGNPLLLFALDRDTRELSAATGGSASWFRNRFRRELSTSAEVRPAGIEVGGEPVPAKAVSLAPYAGEPRAGRFQAWRYVFTLSESVPGWFQEIRTELPAEEDHGAVLEVIRFAGTAPLPEGAG